MDEKGFDVVWRLGGRKGGKAVDIYGVGELCRKAFKLRGDGQRAPSPLSFTGRKRVIAPCFEKIMVFLVFRGIPCPLLLWQDLMETIRVQNRKTRLLERSALVAELHPDQVRREELRLEEQGQRTVRKGEGITGKSCK